MMNDSKPTLLKEREVIKHMYTQTQTLAASCSGLGEAHPPLYTHYYLI